MPRGVPDFTGCRAFLLYIGEKNAVQNGMYRVPGGYLLNIDQRSGRSECIGNGQSPNCVALYALSVFYLQR